MSRSYVWQQRTWEQTFYCKFFLSQVKSETILTDLMIGFLILVFIYFYALFCNEENGSISNVLLNIGNKTNSSKRLQNMTESLRNRKNTTAVYWLRNRKKKKNQPYNSVIFLLILCIHMIIIYRITMLVICELLFKNLLLRNNLICVELVKGLYIITQMYQNFLVSYVWIFKLFPNFHFCKEL